MAVGVQTKSIARVPVMRIYLAGNYVSGIKEYKMMQTFIPRADYRRLVSFYFSKEAGIGYKLTEKVMQAREKVEGERK